MVQLATFDFVPPDAGQLGTTSLLYLFEDNVAVNRRIDERSSPNMRHVSKTDRADLDWLYERSDLHCAITIKYVNNAQYLEDISTTETFTRDRWVHFFSLVEPDGT